MTSVGSRSGASADPEDACLVRRDKRRRRLERQPRLARAAWAVSVRSRAPPIDPREHLAAAHAPGRRTSSRDGRFVFEIVFSGGKRSSRAGRWRRIRDVLQAVLAEVAERGPSTSPAVAARAAPGHHVPTQRPGRRGEHRRRRNPHRSTAAARVDADPDSDRARGGRLGERLRGGERPWRVSRRRRRTRRPECRPPRRPQPRRPRGSRADAPPQRLRIKRPSAKLVKEAPSIPQRR